MLASSKIAPTGPHLPLGDLVVADEDALSVRSSLRAGLGASVCTDASEHHAHEGLELAFVYSGVATYAVGSRRHEVGAGTLILFWAGTPHRLCGPPPGTELMWMHVPLLTLCRWSLGDRFMGRLTGGDVLTQSISRWDAELTRQWVRDLASPTRIGFRAVELELEARLRRVAGAWLDSDAPASLDDEGQRHVETIVSFLRQHFREEISMTDVGAAAALHPRYAMNVFRKRCGLTIGQYLTRLRLAHAQALLLTTDKKIVTIALESGFGSLSRFYDVFTRVCGTTPRDFRRRGV